MYHYFEIMMERLGRVSDDEKEEVVEIFVGAFCTERRVYKKEIERDKRLLENFLLINSDDSKIQVDILTERIKEYTRRLELIDKYL